MPSTPPVSWGVGGGSYTNTLVASVVLRSSESGALVLPDYQMMVSKGSLACSTTQAYVGLERGDIVVWVEGPTTGPEITAWTYSPDAPLEGIGGRVLHALPYDGDMAEVHKMLPWGTIRTYHNRNGASFTSGRKGA